VLLIVLLKLYGTCKGDVRYLISSVEALVLPGFWFYITEWIVYKVFSLVKMELRTMVEGCVRGLLCLRVFC